MIYKLKCLFGWEKGTSVEYREVRMTRSDCSFKDLLNVQENKVWAGFPQNWAARDSHSLNGNGDCRLQSGYGEMNRIKSLSFSLASLGKAVTILLWGLGSEPSIAWGYFRGR